MKTYPLTDSVDLALSASNNSGFLIDKNTENIIPIGNVHEFQMNLAGAIVSHLNPKS